MDPETKAAKAKYSYLENTGCMVFLIVAVICFVSIQIMMQAFESSNAFAGALAVAALSAMGIGVTYFMVRVKND